MTERKDGAISGLYGYLNDHLSGAAAAIRLAERCRAREAQSELGGVLQALLVEIEEDRGVLQRVMLWEVLGTLASSVWRLVGFDFPGLERRAETQRRRLEPFRLKLAAAALAG